MITGINLNETKDYSLKKDKDNPTVFKIGVIPRYVLSTIIANNKNDPITSAYRVVQCGIKGWENFNIKYTTETMVFGERSVEVVPLSILDALELDEIMELSEQVLELNKLSKAEQKN